MNQLVNQSAAAAASNPFAQASVGAGDKNYMKFSGNTGEFNYGHEYSEEMPAGSILAAAMSEAVWTWTFWWEGERLDTIEELLVDAPTLHNEEPNYLPDAFDEEETGMDLDAVRAAQKDRSVNDSGGWTLTATLPLREISGEMTEFDLRLSSKGAIRAFRGLVNAYSKKYTLPMYHGKVPLVELDSTSFTIKGIAGKKYAPVLKLKDWVSEEELVANAMGEDDAYDDGGDAGADTKALAAPEKEDAPAAEEAPKPRGRGRGRGSRNYG